MPIVSRITAPNRHGAPLVYLILKAANAWSDRIYATIFEEGSMLKWWCNNDDRILLEQWLECSTQN